MAPYALASKKHVAPYARRSKVTAGPVVNLPVPYSHKNFTVPTRTGKIYGKVNWLTGFFTGRNKSLSPPNSNPKKVLAYLKNCLGPSISICPKMPETAMFQNRWILPLHKCISVKTIHLNLNRRFLWMMSLQRISASHFVQGDFSTPLPGEYD